MSPFALRLVARLGVLGFLISGMGHADVMNSAEMPSYGAWTSSMIGGGGWMQNVVFTRNPQVLYTYEDVGGFYRSDDAGQHWHMLTGNLPNSFTITGSSQVRGVVADPKNENHILVACGMDSKVTTQGIYESSDGGRSFNLRLTARFAGNAQWRQDGFLIARAPDDSKVLLAASADEGIFRSTDGGTTWTLSGANTVAYDFTDVKFDQHNALLAYACAQASKKTEPPGFSGFFVSTNGGVTWTMPSAASPTELSQDPAKSAPSRFYGLFNTFGPATGAVFYSDDGGVSWMPTTGLPGNVNYRAITASTPSQGFTLVASTTGLFYKLATGQTEWTPVSRKSVDYRGWTWTAGVPPPRNMVSYNPSSISIDPNNANHWFQTDAFGIYETTDAGAGWSLRLDGVESTVINTLCQDPSTGRVHVGMDDNAYLNSVDGGTSFQSVWIPGIYNVKDIELSPSLPSRVYMTCGLGSTSNQLLISTDSGATWKKSAMTGLPAHALFQTVAVSPTDANDVWLGVAGRPNSSPASGGPYESTDGGETWTWMGNGLVPTLSFFFDFNWGYIRRQIATGPPATVGAPCAVAMIRPAANSVCTLNRRTNTWVQATITNCPANPQSIVADPNVAGSWIISDFDKTCTGGIYKLMNGVFTQQYAGDNVNCLAADLKTPGRFAASGINGVVISTDSGVTWKYLDQALPMKQAYNALAFSGKRLLAGSSGSGVYWIIP